MRRTLLALLLLLCLGRNVPTQYRAADCLSHRDGTPALVVFCLDHNLPLPIPYHVSGCLRGRNVDTRLGGHVIAGVDGERIQLHVAEAAFLTYAEAHTYVRTVSRRYPAAVFGLDRIVSYNTDPGIVFLDQPLTEADTLEWWKNGRVTLRTFPTSRACGDAVAVRAHIMRRRCRD